MTAPPDLPGVLGLEGEAPLHCETLLRHLPGRRTVCAGRWRGHRVLAKIFTDRGADRHARRELAVMQAMERHGIPAPAPLLPRPAVAGAARVVLYPFIEGAVPFGEAWRAAGGAERGRLLEALLVLAARQHRAGLEPADPHLDNFLVDGTGRVLAIDGGAYRLRRGPLSLRRCRRSLGLLLAQFPEDAGVDPAPYWRERGVEDPAAFRVALCREVRRWRRYRARKRVEKCQRSCTEFLVRNRQGLRVFQRRELDPALLDRWLEGLETRPGPQAPRLKEGNSQTVWVDRIGDRPVVVKRYNIKSAGHALRRLAGPGRGRRAWRNAHLLQACGIPTPKPLALVEERRGLRRRAWLIMERGAGERADRLAEPEPASATVRRLAALVAAFGRAGLVHGDMKASNFLVDDGRVQVIDLDSLHRPRWRRLRERGIRADRERFLRNWKDPRLRAAFERALAEAEEKGRLC